MIGPTLEFDGDEWARRFLAELGAGAPTPPDRPAPDLRLAMAAELCPMGAGPCGCGSGPPRLCGHPGRPLEVRRADCLGCLPVLDWEAGVEAVG